MRVLIAPVGEQPTPNLIPLFAAKPDERAELVQFLVSDHGRIGKVAEHLRTAITGDAALDGVRVAERDLPMNAWELSKAREECEAAIAHYADHSVIVNLTGGTKIMALAAYQAACKAETPMVYINTERQELLRFDNGQALPPQSFTAPISIQTQLRAAGREFKPYPKKPLLHPADIPARLADFAKYVLDRYIVVHENLIRKVVQLAGKAGQPASFTPPGQSVEAARRAHEIGLWRWDEKAGTITITDEAAFSFLNGGWVEVFALTSLARDGRFDEVLGNVEVEGFEGELDVVVARNGRLGIVECKTQGPVKDEGKTFAVAKIRLHEVIFGGPYATAMFALPSNEYIQQWREICKQYDLPEPIQGSDLKRLADRMAERL
jgi:hypothetical protein